MQRDVQHKVITIVLLVSFFFNLMVPRRVEAVPVAPVVVAFLKDALISAGVTFVANEAIEHVARNIHYNSLTEAEKRALALEGGLSEVTVDDVLRKGYRVPAGTKKIYRVGKASMIAGLVSGVLGVGTSYVIDYMTDDEVPVVDGVTISRGDLDYENVIYYVWNGSGFCTLGDFWDDKGLKYPAGSKFYCEAILEYIEKTDPNYGPRVYIAKSGGGDYTVGRLYNAGDRLGAVIEITRDTEWIRWNPFSYVHIAYINGVKYSGVEAGIEVIVAASEAVARVGFKMYPIISSDYVYRVQGEVQSSIDDLKKTQYQTTVVNEVNANPDKVVYVFVKEDGSQEVALGDATASGDDYPVEPPLPPEEPVVPPPPEAGTEEPDLRRIYNVITRRWPFSLPWDIAYLLGLVCADPVVPVWEFQLPEFMGENNKIQLDLGQYESIMKVVRWFEVFGFAWGLVMVVRRLYGGSV